MPDLASYSYGKGTLGPNFEILKECFSENILNFITLTIFYLLLFTSLLVIVSVLFKSKIARPVKANTKLILKYYLFAFLLRLLFDLITTVLISFISSLLVTILVNALFDAVIVLFTVNYSEDKESITFNL